MRIQGVVERDRRWPLGERGNGEGEGARTERKSRGVAQGEEQVRVS